MTRARLRPLRMRTIGSFEPWMTTVGAVIRRVKRSRLPVPRMASNWRSMPCG